LKGVAVDTEQQRILDEDHIPIQQLARQLRMDKSTVNKWTTHGLLNVSGRRIKLSTIKQAGKRTSYAAYRRWMERLQD
jgi:hypothetical protein